MRRLILTLALLAYCPPTGAAERHRVSQPLQCVSFQGRHHSSGSCSASPRSRTWRVYQLGLVFRISPQRCDAPHGGTSIAAL